MDSLEGRLAGSVINAGTSYNVPEGALEHIEITPAVAISALGLRLSMASQPSHESPKGRRQSMATDVTAAAVRGKRGKNAVDTEVSDSTSEQDADPETVAHNQAEGY